MNPETRAEPAITPRTRPPLPRVVLADRGDPLVAPMADAMRTRFDVVARLDAELSSRERALVAASTLRLDRKRWAERFYKSNLGVTLRSRRASRGLARVGRTADVVFQTHALFDTSDRRTVMYVDCTHRQSMEQWPAWSPQRGPALHRWLNRERRQYQEAAHVFAFSEETARSLVAQYDVPAHQVSVVGAGVNFERLPELERVPDRPPTVLFVGNDFERKGGLRLLEAFARLRERVPDARLLVVGTPDRMKPQPGVEQLGRVHSRERLSRLYAEADVFCLPSYFDPYPGALLEAMAHGLPCVVTTTCGVPEIVELGVTALSVDRGPAMAAQLTDALAWLLTHADEASEMGLRGRERVEERFLWSHVVDRMAPVIERLAGTTPSVGVAPTAHSIPTAGGARP